MSETSAEYRVGFAKLLPEIWTPEDPDYGFGQPLCPDFRAPGNEALAWLALVAYGELLRRNAPPGKSAQLRFTLGLDGGAIVDAFYAAIEDYGRTP